MGLDTTHNAWHGSYSSFNLFRFWLAERIGINLKDYHGYGDENPTKELTSIKHDLMPLFNHSDCDGELTPEECKQIASGLYDVVKSTESNPANDYFIAKAKQFREGCLDASHKNESIEFH